jgi:large subunit ribosomal protein L29
MKAAHLREKTAEDLVELRQSLGREAFQNRLKNFTNRLDDTSSIRKAKRDLARVLTLLRQRELAAAASAPETNREASPAGTAAVAPPKATSKGASVKKGEAKNP